MPAGFAVAGTPIVGAGTLAVTGKGQVSQLWYDVAARAFSNGVVTTAAENETHGYFFQATAALTFTGVKFAYPGGLGAKTVKCSLWSSVGPTRLANASVAVNAAGLYTATFASPYTLVSADQNVDLVLSAWMTDATNAIRLSDSSKPDVFWQRIMSAAPTMIGFMLGPNLLIGATASPAGNDCARAWIAGDNYPSSTAGTERYGFLSPVINDF